ncbi:secretion protein snm4 [Streptomyces piniterrae]|uniref:Secretion protein snm4 n=1 Tax=Streptomyces piniterrae TaxID=2571125 RepID=A0A4U0NDQ3_9ACTN|nr:EsaB/YukD family protein [Streptomyces piniterrae]TJZ51943.1 secretion protein snm4 [Streptomyces piniterrae]
MGTGVSAGAGQRSGLSRVTLVGERRRVELVVPAQESIGALLPDILRLLGERAGSGPSARRLVTSHGAVLAPHDSLASAKVPEGAVLRLIREMDGASASPEPGLADEAADPLDVRGWGWGERTSVWTAVTASVLLAAVAGVCAAVWYGDGGTALWLGIAAVFVVAAGAAIGALAGRTGQHAPAAALLLAGGALGLIAAWQAASGGSARLASVGLTAAAVLALLGLCTPLGRGGLIGAASVALAVGGWELGLALTTPARTGVALGFVSVLVLGYLPRLALMAAGLTRLDDQRSGGTPVSRHQVAAALGATHRGLAPATVAMALSAGAAGVLAAGASGVWTVLVAVLLCVVLFSRARAYPLAVEVVALLAAGMAVCVRLVLLWATDGGAAAGALVALCALAALPVAGLAVRVPEPVRARLRRWLDMVESIGVMALIPVALGAFGVYSLLLGGS